MTFNMENGLCAIAIPGSVGILLRYVIFWKPPGYYSLPASK